MREFSDNSLDGTYAFEIVQFSHFSEYLEVRPLQTFQKVTDALSSNVRYFNPRWLLKNLGQPRDSQGFDQWISVYSAAYENDEA